MISQEHLLCMQMLWLLKILLETHAWLGTYAGQVLRWQ